MTEDKKKEFIAKLAITEPMIKEAFEAGWSARSHSCMGPYLPGVEAYYDKWSQNGSTRWKDYECEWLCDNM